MDENSVGAGAGAGEENEEEEEEAAIVNKNGKRGNYSTKPIEGMAAFFLYARENRERIESAQPEAHFGEVAFALVKEFRALSDEEKRDWDTRVALENIPYKHEMKPFETAGPTTKKQKNDDPLHPKRNKSAFLIFSMANREEIQKNNPEANFGQVAKLISASFNGLSAAEQNKYHAMAAEDKKRYKREMEEYEKSAKSSDEPENDTEPPPTTTTTGTKPHVEL